VWVTFLQRLHSTVYSGANEKNKLLIIELIHPSVYIISTSINCGYGILLDTLRKVCSVVEENVCARRLLEVLGRGRKGWGKIGKGYAVHTVNIISQMQ
jgi:hypothetical protein